MTWPRRILVAYGLALVGGYLAYGLVGFQLRPRARPPLTEQDAATALSFAFGDELGGSTAWWDAAGTSSPGWLVRRAFVQGTRGPDRVRHSEQVLKVGWPFTMVRGFVRTVGEEVQRDGVLAIQGDPRTGPVRLWPIQPVWPGMIINSLWLGAVLLGLAQFARPVRGRPAPT
jgi:hypothetical protein